MKKVTIFTDGACRGNPGPGGYGILLRFGATEKEMRGYAPYTTNNRMELSAAVMALRCLKEPCEVDIYSDSQYLSKGISEWMLKWKRNGWKTAAKKPVLNQDLWMELDKLGAEHRIAWHWIKGHAGHPENERCDQLANLAIDEKRI